MKKCEKFLWKLILFPVSFSYYKSLAIWKKEFVHRYFFKRMVTSIDYSIFSNRSIVKKMFITIPYLCAISIYRYDNIFNALNFLIKNYDAIESKVLDFSNYEAGVRKIFLPEKYRYLSDKKSLMASYENVNITLRNQMPVIIDNKRKNKCINNIINIIIPVYNGIEHLKILIPLKN